MNLNEKSVLQETKNVLNQRPKLCDQKEEHLLKMEQKTINQKVNRHLLIKVEEELHETTKTDRIKEAIHQNKKIWRLQKQQRISLRVTQRQREKRIAEGQITATPIHLIHDPMTLNNERSLFLLVAISTIMVFTA